MNDIAERAEVELVDDAPFLAPVSTDLLDTLLAQHRQARARIAEVVAFVKGEVHASVLHYFLEGNQDQSRGGRFWERSADQLFDEAGAVAALNAAFWSKALSLTDVLDLMPQKRRNEWHKSISEKTAPEFEESTVRATLADLIGMRATFFAERVDGIFRGLSGEHVTNAPEAFGKRMIVAHVLSEYHSVNHGPAGLINDLRCVIAKFMGRDEPKHTASSTLVAAFKGRWGEWVPVDGGALRVRLYRKGTAHLEVHPDMAWRLNKVLASIYPLAIPAEFRQKPKRRVKGFEAMGRPLPFPVLELIADMREVKLRVPNAWPERYTTVHNAVQFGYGHGAGVDAVVRDEAGRVLEAIGGVREPQGWWQFDYRPFEVIQEIVVSGCIPDQRAHQFYPTPRGLAARLVELAAIGDAHQVLEPSAGTGGLADLLPVGRTRCVEIAPLHCKVLQAKGHDVVAGDFIEWADTTAERFDRVVMNPPFSGRWQAHVERAAALLKAGGRLVAIVPSGAQNRDIALPGLQARWHGPFDNEFAGTSVSVAILEAEAE